MRVRILSVIIVICFVLLLIGLAYLQIMRGSFYLAKSTSNRIRLERLEAPRGKIFDRNGVLIAGNRISFDVAVIPQELQEKKEETFSGLSGILGVPQSELEDSFKENILTSFTPAAVKEDIGKEAAIKLEEARLNLPGVILQTRPIRNYIYESAGSHVFGYLGFINKEELSRLRNYGYQRQDLIGRVGLEKSFDSYLKGEEGGMQLEVDNRGRQLRMLGIKEPLQGKNIYLTIDIKLQKFIDDLLDDFRGAVIVVTPDNGQILSITSKPNFDPNLFVSRLDASEIRRLFEDEESPMLNRAINGQYPPGSIFKVVIAAAALEKGRIDDRTQIDCKGSYALGGREFRCWREYGHGRQDIEEAIKNSCNVFFYNLGRMVGERSIAEFARKFGYGTPSGIDLIGEASGVVPNRLWKIMNKREAWYEGDTVNYSIGQGYLLVTPIQVLRMMTAVANGGKLVQPYLVEKIDVIDVSPPTPKAIEVSTDTIELIREGLAKVVNDDDGTGFYARVPGLLMAGKTGTAQAGGEKSHAWFSGFSPIDEPKVCVLVFLEHGGKGGLNASRVARKIFEELNKLGYL